MLGNKFIIRTDQKSLRYLLDQTITIEAQQKWLVKLLSYNFTNEKGPGKFRCSKSILKRRAKTAMCTLKTIPQSVELIKEEAAREPKLQNLVKLINEGEAIEPWS